jgi:hypothetical protein
MKLDVRNKLGVFEYSILEDQEETIEEVLTRIYSSDESLVIRIKRKDGGMIIIPRGIVDKSIITLVK